MQAYCLKSIKFPEILARVDLSCRPFLQLNSHWVYCLWPTRFSLQIIWTLLWWQCLFWSWWIPKEIPQTQLFGSWLALQCVDGKCLAPQPNTLFFWQSRPLSLTLQPPFFWRCWPGLCLVSQKRLLSSLEWLMCLNSSSENTFQLSQAWRRQCPLLKFLLELFLLMCWDARNLAIMIVNRPSYFKKYLWMYFSQYTYNTIINY